MDAIALSLFSSRIAAVCDEMGAVLRRAAFSTNIRDRLDYSCAVFDAQGELCAQAAHIPVHLGSMAYAMTGLVNTRHWRPGDMLVVNDPFQGGTHLPDVTLVAPVFDGDSCVGFVVNRAHHADIGADAPGSMPITACLEEEGLIIAPTLLLENHAVIPETLAWICNATSDPVLTQGDFSAQISANLCGAKRLQALVSGLGMPAYNKALAALNAYAEKLSSQALSVIPEGTYRFKDVMDDDGFGHTDLQIVVSVHASGGAISVDFTGTAAQTEGNINCPLSVAAAAVYYVFRCLMAAETPASSGAFRPIKITAPEGCLLNATAPAAVAAGNVETSSRVVDVVLGALAQAIPERIPAASQGTMNNLAMGARNQAGNWNYYETLAGGMGAHAQGEGLSAVQTHMTNTLNTPIEVFETAYPVRIKRYCIRRGAGGTGLHYGGDGLCREYEFLADAEVTLITERRSKPPWGLCGGQPGRPGENRLNGSLLPAKISLTVAAGDCLEISTPGGGGYGER